MRRFLCALLVWFAAVSAAGQDPNTVCRVQCGSSVGSGVYLGDRLVLSCAHVFDDEPTTAVSVTFPGGQSSAGRMLGKDRSWDQSCIELQTDPGIAGAPLADENPEQGDEVTAAGYDHGRELKLRRGRVTQFVTQQTSQGLMDWFELNAQVVSGCSGGPVFNSQGEVIGNLWGAGNGTTVALMCGRTRRFLLPWNTRLEAIRIAQWGGGCRPACPPGTMPVMPGPSTTAPPRIAPGPTPVPPPVTVEVIVAALLANEKFIEAVRGPVGPAGEPGMPGPPGETGPAGPAGAPVDVDALAAAIRAALPPITVATVDRNGHQQILGEAHLGEMVVLPPITFHGLRPDGTVQDAETVPLGGRLDIQYPGMREKQTGNNGR